MYRRIVAVWISLVMMLSVIIIVIDIAPPASGITITVDDSGGADFTKIQDAINASSDGDTVFIYNGTYYEHIVINKTINLIGEDKNNTIIDGGGSGTVIKIIADWVNISEMKIDGSGYFSYDASIWIESDNNTIVNCTITSDGRCGVFLSSSLYNLVYNNNISGNYYAIRLESSSFNSILENSMLNNDWGIKGLYSNYTSFINNTVINGQIGVSLKYSSNSTIIGNNISHQNYGLSLYESTTSTIAGNQITSNWYYGISLLDFSDIIISDNFLSNNGDSDLDIDSVINCKADNNTFNGTGIYIKGDSIEYWITHEIDTSNTIDGKSIYYLKNKSVGVIPPGMAGQVFLVNCSNFDVMNQNIEDAPMGVTVVYSSDINIGFNDFYSSRYYDIYVSHSPRINVLDNSISQSESNAISVWYSPNSTILHNSVLDSRYTISLHNSPFGNVSYNQIIENLEGIRIRNSSFSTIIENTCNDTGRGVDLAAGSQGNLILNNNLSYGSYGVFLGSGCNNNTITNNTVFEFYEGIRLSSHGNTIKGNEITNNYDGIRVSSSPNDISANRIISNGRYGIYIWITPGLNITDNEFIKDGIFIDGTMLSHFNSHEIPDDNTVNGKPLYYYKDINGLNLDGIPVGQLILANCNNVNVNNVVINETDVGIEGAYITNGNFTNCNISSNNMAGLYLKWSSYNNIATTEFTLNNEYGVHLDGSHYNNITGNYISSSSKEDTSSGVYLDSSTHNNITNNHVLLNDNFGVYLSSSSSTNVITQNEVMMNGYGIRISSSNNNEISGNNISKNEKHGIYFYQSSNTIIADNNITANQNGIHVGYNSVNANISENTILYNDYYGIHLYEADNAKLILNEFIDDGIFISGWEISNYNSHEIPVNNLVNGKPLYYFKNIAGLDIEGVPVGQLLLANCTHVNISNIEIEYTDVAIEAAYSSNISITATNISNNYHGIYFIYTLDNKITGSNISSNALDGIYLYHSYNDQISDNFITLNERYGLFISSSSFSNITNNIFVKDGVFIRGSGNTHDISLSNMVNDKPLYYYKNVNGFEFDGILAGQVIFANCTNINVMNVQINDTDVGIEFVKTWFSDISSCSLFNNLYGIYCFDTWLGNNITDNTITSNYEHGIVVEGGYEVKIEGNDISQNDNAGINILDAGFNYILNNSISSNGGAGIHLREFSWRNIIKGNNISFNAIGIDIESEADINRIYHNNFINNVDQVEIEDYNYWDNGYPSGGNYWSDFSPTCPDLYNGSTTPQTTGSPDGICDYPYQELYTMDHYPLKYPWGIISPDTVPPATIMDLEVTDPTIDSLTLSWTAPGDDGDSGTVAGYVVKYSTSGPITEGNWDAATTYSQSWIPLGANSTETYVISGLALYTTYWFAIKAYDEMGNYGGVSISPSGTTLHTDMTSPAAITDLGTSDRTNSSITLTWTAVADNGSDAASGNASLYDIRYMIGTEINIDNWDAAVQVGGEATPGAPGTIESFVVTNLLPGTTYYFAVKAGDEVPLWSALSNSPNTTTLGNDTAQPVISGVASTPPVQEIGWIVNMSATITDNAAVASAHIEVKDPFSTVLGNYTMIRIDDIYYYKILDTASLGSYTFTIWALDINDNSASAIGSFEVVDTSAPDINGTQAEPSVQELDGAVNITVQVNDNVRVEGVWLQILTPSGTELENVSMNRAGQSDNYWYNRIYSDIGDFKYYVWAKDTKNNWNCTENNFVIQDMTLPSADAGSGMNILQGEVLTFDGSGSSDNHEIANYTWSFEYDEESHTFYGTSPSFTFEIIGNYTITLTVTDPSGNSASDSIWINVIGVDSDNDGLTDWDEENIYGTKPGNPDTDGDGANDGDEIQRGTDPMVPDKGEEPGKSFIENYWWIFVIIAAMIFLLLVFILTNRKEEDLTKDEEKVEEESLEPESADEDKEPATEVTTSPLTTEQDMEPAAETQPVKRKPPRPPRAPKSQA